MSHKPLSDQSLRKIHLYISKSRDRVTCQPHILMLLIETLQIKVCAVRAKECLSQEVKPTRIQYLSSLLSPSVIILGSLENLYLRSFQTLRGRSVIFIRLLASLLIVCHCMIPEFGGTDTEFSVHFGLVPKYGIFQFIAL